MLKKDEVEAEGIVLENLPNATFRVQMAGDKLCLCTLSGKMRMNHIRILPGDRVKFILTPYDQARGRIVFRMK
ncbi:translation initiation factor IF-1 [Candidatus Shapirobacteria bacterium CG09_land_8_20_14_0_10_39_12]|uniref:Translation initiation factor IF-1 n=1 Tax=Candidatus Shapirobacteria bacterium CG09_land_8_20_14_0_10_39_12 TaxID=1974885 RepID=A0A2H0WP23_9BACT|nr:MAG: translation initiation factor IF-1 [Candidatus Shapirobacteria bacterium CG09_land_8_20_14_0_10_39_12]